MKLAVHKNHLGGGMWPYVGTLGHESPSGGQEISLLNRNLSNPNGNIEVSHFSNFQIRPGFAGRPLRHLLRSDWSNKYQKTGQIRKVHEPPRNQSHDFRQLQLQLYSV